MMRLVSSVLIAIAFGFAFGAEANESPSVNAAYATGGEIVNAAQSELGFMERYVPLSLPETLHPRVEEQKTITWLGGVLWGGMGSFLISYFTLDDRPDHDEALMAGLIHWIGSAVFLMSLIGSPMFCIDHLYLAPVAVLSAWDRAYKEGGTKRQVEALHVHPAIAMAY